MRLRIETLIQLFDELEDLTFAALLSVHRALSPRPRERRRVVRSSPAADYRP